MHYKRWVFSWVIRWWVIVTPCLSLAKKNVSYEECVWGAIDSADRLECQIKALNKDDQKQSDVKNLPKKKRSSKKKRK